MQISTRVKYGLRAMIELALQPKGEPLSISSIAERNDLSVKYLENLMIQLKNAGLVYSKRGKEGGYYLSREPADISIREIFIALDGPLDLSDCVNDPVTCVRSANCKANKIWARVSSYLNEQLQSISLEQVLEDRC